jgi:hypothetical protein
VFHSDDGGTSWCWVGTGVDVGQLDGTNAVCKDWEKWTGLDPADDPIVRWTSCSPDSQTFFDEEFLLSPTDIKGVPGAGHASVMAVRSSIGSGGEQGLWFTLHGGAGWDKVQNFNMKVYKTEDSDKWTCTKRNILDLAWGGNDRAIPGLNPMEKYLFSDLYAATNGSGIYQWSTWWSY